MTATTFPAATPRPRVTTAPRPHRLATALRAIRAFGGAAATVALLGGYGPPEAGVRNPRPEYAPGPDRVRERPGGPGAP
ncbi:hypothetical protein GCM10010275_33750 [Streptomyces litmocidini]|uniref:hypothetical protein n=1 Tax=Streptomyces litmocidini TaxID=67318 RepID=UPI00167D88E9|nr:hypothetical protein [Streptomyces litmocidini]GGU93547.1 hypothetical protein GCM10010275_33750 [Streptomyces litmocidini]